MKFKFQLPAPSENFQGRSRELSKLKDYFNTQHIIIIAGMPGIGKTSLAMAYAQAINSENKFLAYHNKVIWIHCEEGWKMDSLLFEIDCWFLDRGIKEFTTIYKSQDITLNEKLQHLSGILENNNIVIFLDDFQNIENEDTILFIRYCKKYLRKSKIIITTRKRLKLSALDRVDIFERRLDGLSLKDAEILIKKLLQQHDYSNISDTAVMKIMEKVKGHPFSIKLFVSLLITEDLAVEELLEDSSEFEEEIEDYLIGKTYDTLHEDEKYILCIFSMFRTPVSLNALKHIAENVNIRKYRASLVDKYLLEPREHKTYSMHDLLKSYCQSQLTEKQKIEFHKKCAEYYDQEEPMLHNKQEAIYHYFEIQEFDKVQEIAFDLIDEMEIQGQLQELMEIIDKTLQCGEENNSLLLLKKAKIFKLWGEIDHAVEIYDSLLEKEDDEILRANAIAEYACLKIDKGLFDESLQMLFDCYEIYEEHNDRESMAVTLNQISVVYGHQNEPELAIETLFRSLEYAKTEKNVFLETKIYNNLGISYGSSGDYSKAIEYINEALKLEKLTGNTKGYTSSLYCLASLNLDKKDYKQSLKIAQEVIELAKEQGDKNLVAYSKDMMGLIYLQRDKRAEALEYFSSALEICEEMEDVIGQAGILFNIARTFYKEGNNVLALNSVNKSNELYENMKKRAKIFFGKMLECLCQIKMDDENACIKLLGELSILCDELNQTKFSAYLNKLYQLFYEQKHDVEKAEQYKHSFQKNYEELGFQIKQDIVDFFEEAYSDERACYVMRTRTEEKFITREEVDALVSQKEEFDLWIDLVNKEVREKKKGVIKILKKRTLAPLFLLFIKNPGKEFSFKELFQAIWEREYDFETDGITVRVNISRLRSLLEVNKKSSTYIKISSKGGKYFFEKNSNYCLIMEKEKI